MSKALVAVLALIVAALLYAAFHVTEIGMMLLATPGHGRWLTPILLSLTVLMLFALHLRRRAGR